MKKLWKAAFFKGTLKDALLFCQHKTSFGKFRTVSFFMEIPIQNGEATIIFQKEKRKQYGTKNKNMAQ